MMVIAIRKSDTKTDDNLVELSAADADEILETDVEVKLKWFNQPKGFGFVVPNDKDVDAFLHITTLQKAEIQNIGEGAVLICDIGYGSKGAMVRAVKAILDAGLMPGENSEELVQKSGFNGMEGTVKWYKPDKGFGFVIPDDGKKDVFVHKTCLEKHDIDSLIPGQRIKMAVKDVPKGREAVTIELTGSNDTTVINFNPANSAE
ncbi:MAG: cold shock domain-containing protein [Alphaproteobacteria bacterium]|nr:cold shock domain-containing protein [Alphaproteobacteria bacterium]